MSSWLASVLAAVLRLQNCAAALVLAAFVGVALRALVSATLGQRALPPRLRAKNEEPWRRRLRTGGALLVAGLALGLGALYAVVVYHAVVWNTLAVVVATATLLVILGALVATRITGIRGPRGVTGLLLRAVLFMALMVLALITMMRAGFMALTEDKPVLLVELTGATAVEEVSWAPADGEARREKLATHEVLFRRPADGALVGQAWVYGDEIAVKARVLRLSPFLNAAGISNLFRLTFAFNGYRSIERHSSYPHKAFPLAPVGPLAVHPLWRSTQDELIRRWESGTADGSVWLIRSATTESTFFPLTDDTGRPKKRTYRLVVTPGGLSAS
jgi:hypothetical protein